MELFYTLTSPYSRKILLVADHLGLSDQMTRTVFYPLDNTSGRLAAVNPLEKIPTLLLGNGEVIYDSPVIAEVLFHRANAPALAFEERLKQQKMQALADGIMDAAVLSQLESCREDTAPSAYWQDRWRQAMLRAVAEFDRHMIGDAMEWHIGSMSMACALDYMRFRHSGLNWMENSPAAHDWYQTVMKKDIMTKTDPRSAG